MGAKTSSTTHDPRTAPRTSGGSRFVAITFTGLGVLVIAACAVLLSYNGIYQIARQGNIEPRYAHLYPGAFTLLLLMCFWTSYVLRDAPRARRLGVDAIILVLILIAACASALEPLGYELLPDVAVVVTAVAPWVALLIAFRIWLWMVSHLRGERSGAPRRSRRSRPVDSPDTVDTAPLPTEPTPASARTEPTHRDTEPIATTPKGGDGDTTPTTPALLWPRSGKRYASSERSVRVLDDDEVETRNDTGTDTGPSTARTSGERGPVSSAPDSPAAASEHATSDEADSIIPFARTTPEVEEDAHTSASESAPAGDATATAPVAVTDSPDPDEAAPRAAEPVPDARAAALADESTTGVSSEPAGSVAVGEKPMEDPPEKAPDQPTLGQLLRRALLPDNEPAPATTAADEPEPDPTARSDLPKRTPKTAWNRSRDTEPADLPAAGDPAPTPAVEESGNGVADPSEQVEDGFVHTLPADDPTNDEANPHGEWTAGPAPEPSEPATGAASHVEKRPMVLKPRRSAMDEFPAAPPSGRVRSEPTPPESTQE